MNVCVDNCVFSCDSAAGHLTEKSFKYLCTKKTAERLDIIQRL